MHGRSSSVFLFIGIFLSAVLLFASVTSAHAQDLPPGIFLMKDGKYFQPSTNKISASLDEILGRGAVSAPSDLPTPSDNPTSVTTTTPDTAGSSVVILTLPDAIHQAQSQLSLNVAQDAIKPRIIVTDQSAARIITLALWSEATSSIRYVTGLKDGNKFTPNNPPEASISVLRTNGVNSTYRVNGPANEMVVAVRYPIARDIGTKKKPKFELDDVVYTPYSSNLHTPEMVRAGSAWLDALTTKVVQDMRQSGELSRASSTQSVADTIDTIFAKEIAIIEHADYHALEQSPRHEVERVLVTLAANQDKSFTESRSSAGALGLVQFMPKSYAYIVMRHPALKLPTNFERAMRDPSVAIRAEMAYLSDISAEFPNASGKLLNEFIAASYNGGSARVKKASAAWEDNTDPKLRLAVRSRSRLRAETMDYVRKLRMVDAVLSPVVQVALVKK